MNKSLNVFLDDMIDDVNELIKKIIAFKNLSLKLKLKI